MSFMSEGFTKLEMTDFGLGGSSEYLGLDVSIFLYFPRYRMHCSVICGPPRMSSSGSGPGLRCSAEVRDLYLPVSSTPV